MLTNGYNHVATLTNDTERLHAFYVEVFDAEGAERWARGGRGVPSPAVDHRRRARSPS